MKRIFFFFLFFLVTSFVVAGESRPNILFIFTDDHAYQAIGAYGSNRNETPNLDRLAAEGMRFTNCCVTNSICGPSRAVIQTGKYSHLNGFRVNGDKFDVDQQTFPKLLQKAGYQTAVIGKWHLGSEANANAAGFDYTEILIDQGPYYNPSMFRNGERVNHTGHTTAITTDLALQWLENRDKSKPFLLMTQHKAPHREWDAYPEYYEQYRNTEFSYPQTFDDDYSGNRRAALEQDMTISETLTPRDLKLTGPPGHLNDEQKAAWHKMFDGRQAEFEAVENDPVALKRWKYQCYMKDYMSCVAAVDDGIGKMLKYLDENGLTENTIVVYASDQGFYLGEHGWFDKRFMYNESFKTPLIVRWPGKVKPGSVNHDIVSNLDFPETFLDLAGASVPDDMQGRSLVPVLQGQTPEDWRKSFYYHYYEYPSVHMVKKHEGVYDGRFKLIHFYDDIDEWELYDLENDPNEMLNVYSRAENAQEVARLAAELKRLKTELGLPKQTGENAPHFFSIEPSGQIEQIEATAAEVVEKCGGQVVRDTKTGRIIEVDVASNRSSVDDAAFLTIMQLKGLKKLSVSGGSLTAESLKQLESQVLLEELFLVDTITDGTDLATLCKKMPKLKRLTLRRLTKLSDQGLKPLHELKELRNLSLLNLSISGPGLETVAALASLRALDLRGCNQLATEDYRHLVKMTALADLKIGGASLNAEVLRTVTSLPNLTSLTVEDAAVTAEIWEELFTLPRWRENMVSLTFARMYSVTDRVLEKLSGFKKLKSLSLRAVPVRGTFVGNLPPDSPLFETLETLVMTKSFATADEIPFLKQFRNLKKLDFSETPMTEEMIEALSTLTFLETLILTNEK